uniref:Uncharacterized protein n=1 Tax=Cacopsylla melanoneura TaxID=428564 RepID=A0A8D8XJB5_9HEMI
MRFLGLSPALGEIYSQGLKRIICDNQECLTQIIPVKSKRTCHLSQVLDIQIFVSYAIIMKPNTDKTVAEVTSTQRNCLFDVHTIKLYKSISRTTKSYDK